MPHNTKLSNFFFSNFCVFRASEGKTVEIEYRGDVEKTIQDILGGIRSTCTYVGASKLKELSRRTTFIRVTQQLNEVFTPNTTRNQINSIVKLFFDMWMFRNLQMARRWAKKFSLSNTTRNQIYSIAELDSETNKGQEDKRKSFHSPTSLETRFTVVQNTILIFRYFETNKRQGKKMHYINPKG